jgi:hypothetical protein
MNQFQYNQQNQRNGNIPNIKSMYDIFHQFLRKEQISSEDIDPLNIIPKEKYSRFTSIPSVLDAIFRVYQQLRIRNHPDKGGDKNEFHKMTSAMGIAKHLIEILKGDLNHGDLKKNYEETLRNEAPLQKKKELSNPAFNRMFEEANGSELANIYASGHNVGYQNMMEKSGSDIIQIGNSGNPGSYTGLQRKNIDIERMSEYNPRRFHEDFRQKKMMSSQTQIVEYKPPEAANTNMGGATTTFLELGNDVNNFTMPVGMGSIDYTDYKQAFEEPFLIDESSVQNSASFNDRNVTFEDLKNQRNNPESARMTREQQLAVERAEMEAEKREWQRLQRFNQINQLALKN